MQVAIALIIAPQGFPLAYEALPGNTADDATLKDILGRIERQYQSARRIWLMDRGIPNEEVLEQALLEKPWKPARPDVRVKLLAQDQELYVLAESRDRIARERSMRRRQLKWLWAQLQQLPAMLS